MSEGAPLGINLQPRSWWNPKILRFLHYFLTLEHNISKLDVFWITLIIGDFFKMQFVCWIIDNDKIMVLLWSVAICVKYAFKYRYVRPVAILCLFDTSFTERMPDSKISLLSFYWSSTLLYNVFQFRGNIYLLIH